MVKMMKEIFLALFLCSYVVKLGEYLPISIYLSPFLFLLFLLSTLIDKESYKIRFCSFDIFVFIVLLTSITWSINSGLSDVVTFYIIQLFLYGFIPYFFIRFFWVVNEFTIVRLSKAMISIGPFVIILMLSMIGYSELFKGFRLGDDNLFNPVGIAFNFLSIGLFSFYLVTRRDINIFYKILGFICFLSSLVVIIMTGSRGSIFLFLVMFLFLTSKFITNKLLIFIVMLILFLVVGISFSLLDSTMLDARFADPLNSGSALERKTQYSQAFTIFYDNPLLGGGFAVFSNTYGSYPHNLFLELIANFGVLGILFFFQLLLFCLYSLYRSYFVIKSDGFLLISTLLLCAFAIRLISFPLANMKELLIYSALFINYNQSLSKRVKIIN